MTLDAGELKSVPTLMAIDRYDRYDQCAHQLGDHGGHDVSNNHQ